MPLLRTGGVTMTLKQRVHWRVFCHRFLAGYEENPWKFQLEREEDRDENFRSWLKDEWNQRSERLFSDIDTDSVALDWVADLLQRSGYDIPPLTPRADGFRTLIVSLPSTKAWCGKVGLAERLLVLTKFANEIGLKIPPISFDGIEEIAETFRVNRKK